MKKTLRDHLKETEIKNTHTSEEIDRAMACLIRGQKNKARKILKAI